MLRQKKSHTGTIQNQTFPKFNIVLNCIPALVHLSWKTYGPEQESVYEIFFRTDAVYMIFLRKDAGHSSVLQF